MASRIFDYIRGLLTEGHSLDAGVDLIRFGQKTSAHEQLPTWGDDETLPSREVFELTVEKPRLALIDWADLRVKNPERYRALTLARAGRINVVDSPETDE
jgi:hypothetical protein